MIHMELQFLTICHFHIHFHLRIDNSGRSVIYTFDHKSETVLVIITCNIPTERLYFSLSFDISAIIVKCDLRMF